MNILIDIGHPGHVHLFKNLYFELINRNHNVFVTVKNILLAKKLLHSYGIPFIIIGKKYDNLVFKIINQIKYDLRIWRIVQKENIEIGIGTSVSIANVSVLTKMKSIVLDDDDDEVQPLFVKSAHLLSDVLLSPDVLKNKRKQQKTVYYPGLHELAYLHPERFAPDRSVLDALGLKENEKFFLLRFNSFKAHHDLKAKGLSLPQKIEILKLLEKYGKVFVTSERELDPEFSNYECSLSPEKIHSLLYYATLFVGDSQTMTSEAAVLGTPAIRCNSFVGRISYLEEEEVKYGLTFGFSPDYFKEMKRKISELLAIKDLKKQWQKKRNKLLEDKIDTTGYLLDYVEGYIKQLERS